MKHESCIILLWGNLNWNKSMCHDPTVWKKTTKNTFAQLERNPPEHDLLYDLTAREKHSLEKAAFSHEVKVMCCLPKCWSIGSPPLPSLSACFFHPLLKQRACSQDNPSWAIRLDLINSFLFFFSFSWFHSIRALSAIFQTKSYM